MKFDTNPDTVLPLIVTVSRYAQNKTSRLSQ